MYRLVSEAVVEHLTELIKPVSPQGSSAKYFCSPSHIIFIEMCLFEGPDLGHSMIFIKKRKEEDRVPGRIRIRDLRNVQDRCLTAGPQPRSVMYLLD